MSAGEAPQADGSPDDGGSTPAPDREVPPRLTFASGGWVIVLSLVLCGAVVAWAMMGVLFGVRPLGDGADPATYGFDLSTSRLGDAVLSASGQPRDFLDALDHPETIAGDEVIEFNRRERGKFLVSSDRVIGVTIAGDSRAYPLRVLNAHEVCNDTLGGVPIAVTYSPLTDSVVVFDRRLDAAPDIESTEGGAPRTLRLGVSGLLLDSNTLYYDRDEPVPPGEHPPSLWSQLAMRAVAGPDADAGGRLRPIADVQVTSWAEWFEHRPETTVVLRDPRAARRYKEFDYRRYYNGGRPLFPIRPDVDEAAAAADGVEVMTPMIVVLGDAQPGSETLRAAPVPVQGSWTVAEPGSIIVFMRWFAWRAFEDELRRIADER